MKPGNVFIRGIFQYTTRSRLLVGVTRSTGKSVNHRVVNLTDAQVRCAAAEMDGNSHLLHFEEKKSITARITAEEGRRQEWGIITPC